MKIIECGKKNGKTLLLLPGTGCCVKANFKTVLPLLKQEYHLILVDYDGFDGRGGTFRSMQKQTEKIENYLIKRFKGKIDGAYGSSLGGSFVGLMAQRERIHMDHGILGSSDLDQAGKVSAFFLSWMIVPLFTRIMHSGNLPKWFVKIYAQKHGEEAGRKLAEMVQMLAENGNRFTVRSMWNQYYSDLVTPLQTGIQVPGTKIHIFYALGMGEKYRQRYLTHFYEPDIRENPYDHETLLALHPDEWLQEVNRGRCPVPGAGNNG